MITRQRPNGSLPRIDHRPTAHQRDSYTTGYSYVLVNDALNTFYLRLNGVRHLVKDYSDSERENPLLPNGLLFPISSKGSFICIIPQTG